MNSFILICFSVFCIVIIGFYNVIINVEKNGCEMTYMFEYPQYVKISLDKDKNIGPGVLNKYRGYGLYAYSEGRFTEKTRRMQFSGIPVLFIHGHRGSYKQVRSLSSVSLRKALKSKVGFHFDFFSVDLNEEYSGFYGGVLQRQTEFVRICIDHILSLYSNPKTKENKEKCGEDCEYRPPAPHNVVLFAHSMGGMIAKGLFLRDMSWSKVNLIITLATPHTPVVLLDSSAASYYEEVNDFWHKTNVSDNVTLISIGGGTRDLIVHSGHVFTPHAHISVVSSDVQDVWLETDHLSITWCKELILVLVRGLFDSVDLNTKRVSDDPRHRLNVFKYHLLERSGSKNYRLARQSNQTHLLLKSNNMNRSMRESDDSVTWLRLRKNHLTWIRRDKLTVQTNILIPLSNTPQPADTILITTLNHYTEHWIFSCKPDYLINNIKVCSTGDDLSWKARISPSNDLKRKTILLDLLSLRMQPQAPTHLVVVTKPTVEHVEITFDLFVLSERGSPVESGLVRSQTLVDKTMSGEVYRWFSLPGLVRPWQAYKLHTRVNPQNCSTSFYSYCKASLNVPWQHQGSHLLLNDEYSVAPITIYTEKPSDLYGRKNDVSNHVKVSLLLEPSCSYNVRLEASLWLSLGRLIVRNYPSVLVFISVVLIMCLSWQIECLGKSGDCPIIHITACKATKPYYILPAANILASIARSLHGTVGKTDIDQHSGIVETLFLPLLLHCSAVSLTLILSSLLLLAVVFHGQAFNSLLLKFISKLCLGVPWISEWIMSGISKMPVIVSCLMLLLVYSACSSLAIYVGLTYYFIKIVMYYEDFWDEIVYWPLRFVRATLINRFTKKQINIKPLELPPLTDLSFHLTLLLIWFVIAIITTPSLLSWAHSYRYSKWLESDPFISSGIILSICGGFLWQAETPRTHLTWSKETSKIILSSCVVIIVYCQISLYRLERILSFVIFTVSSHQLVASNKVLKKEEENEIEEKEDCKEIESNLSPDVETLTESQSISSSILESVENKQSLDENIFNKTPDQNNSNEEIN